MAPITDIFHFFIDHSSRSHIQNHRSFFYLYSHLRDLHTLCPDQSSRFLGMDLVWVLCLIGILFKFFFVYPFKILSTLIYILMGWVGVIAGNQLLTHIRTGGLLLLLIGGLSCTGGTVFYAWKRLSYHHAIWHLFVIVGSTCHYFAVMFYVLPL